MLLVHVYCAIHHIHHPKQVECRLKPSKHLSAPKDFAFAEVTWVHLLLHGLRVQRNTFQHLYSVDT